MTQHTPDENPQVLGLVGLFISELVRVTFGFCACNLVCSSIFGRLN